MNLYEQQLRELEINEHLKNSFKKVKGRMMEFNQELDYLYKKIKKLRLSQKHQLQYIVFIVKMFDVLPDYFFKIPASSTGKYHPKCSLGEKGLIRHTKVALRVAKESFVLNTMFDLSKTEQVEAYIALMFHDGFKNGTASQNNGYTNVRHPIIVRENMEIVLEYLAQKDYICDDSIVISLNNCLRSVDKHMGQWTKDYRSKKVVLERPETRLEKFIHICDYMASRKMFDYYTEMVKNL